MGKNKEKIKQESLRSLEQEYGSVKKEIQNLGYIVSGTITKRQYRCGKQTCRCHRDPTKLHGPYYHWTRKIKGKTVSINLDKKTAASLSEYSQNNRKIRELIDKLRCISMEILKASENLKDI